jgi:hypothetical protein
VSTLIATTYPRPIYGFGGCWLRDEPVTIAADVIQDGGVGHTSELCIVWTDETLARLAALELDAEELIGCEEAIEQAWWDAEAEQCRLANVRQRLGQEATAAE